MRGVMLAQNGSLMCKYNILKSITYSIANEGQVRIANKHTDIKQVLNYQFNL